MNDEPDRIGSCGDAPIAVGEGTREGGRDRADVGGEGDGEGGAPDRLTLHHEGAARVLEPDEALTFGRAADLVVDPSNRLLHRVLGRLHREPGVWTLDNLGRTVAFVLGDLDGPSHARLAPGATMPLPFANVSLAFSAGGGNYRLTLHRDAREMPPAPPGVGRGVHVVTDEFTHTVSRLAFNEEQRQLLEALARPRLDGPITAADLPASRDLADALGWSLSKFNRKLDHLCLKLHRAGLAGVVADASGSARERRLVIANHAVEYGLVSRDRSSD